MNRTVRLVLLVLVVLALVTACGGRKAPTTSPEDAGSSKGSAAQADPQTEAPATPAGPETSGDGEELSVADREAGLDKLNAYRATWNLTWKSTGGEKTEDAAMEWMQEYTRDPEAIHSRWSTRDNQQGGEAETMEWWQVGRTTYMVSGEGSDRECTSMSSEDASIDNTLTGPQTLGSVQGAKLVGTETLNGLRVRHYRYNEKSIALFAAGSVKGDIWVAVDGGYVVKDTATWEGGLFGLAAGDKDAKGSGSWTWELSEINSNLKITPPEGCESAAAGIPMLADATEKTTFGDMQSYKTRTKVADVIKFYQDELKKAGWAPEGEPMTTDQFASLTFKKDGQTASVMISVENDVTSVIVSIQKQ